ncbi:RraA family protein [Bordetella bronchialis]|uniref:Putative 4-hydroxy-4-methyl-2-oxoglutarate aldolase n=1 Tax=Bordetella bronchialis TaxID=463025 RepID=A0A193FWA0_9BORD|nr:4-hydroxy-4-methyl-2-oxoglutarate aldolase [Bordetella bronchialis]ANN71628.1 4-hydroxy-4-methyl-2-oxoglutarate aldolase [Bordetella bronchialis]
MKKYVIGPSPAALDPSVFKLLEDVETATVGHFRHWGFMDPAIQALGTPARIIGRAVTLALPAQDSTLLHHALGQLRPGDVVVIDRLGDRKHACWGGGVTQQASKAGAAGAVVDGVCTDPSEIAAFGMPVWCRGVSPITTRIYDLAGMLNMPVSCGGVVVNPGDVILADENGVLVLPPREIAEVAAMAKAKQARQRANAEKIAAGAALLGELSGASGHVARDG